MDIAPACQKTLVYSNIIIKRRSNGVNSEELQLGIPYNGVFFGNGVGAHSGVNSKELQPQMQ